MKLAVADGEPHLERVLEQVKIRHRLTLRSAEVVSALVRYFEVAREGEAPSLYRFITTAVPGRERSVQFPRNLPGLAAWNSARSGELEAVERAMVVTEARVKPIPS